MKKSYSTQKRQEIAMTAKKLSLADKIKESTNDQAPHVVIIARAGTGKTSTLVEGLKHIKGLKPEFKPSPQQKLIWEQMESSKDAKTICLCSFSNTIVNTLKERVPPKCEARTISSLGYQAVRNSFQLLPGNKAMNGDRVSTLLSTLTGMSIRDLRGKYPVQTANTIKLVNLCKYNLFSGEDHRELDLLVDEFELDLADSREKIYAKIPKLLNRCKQVELDKYIDFTDQLWLPVVLDLPVPRYDLLLVDEVQDCNRAQQELAYRMGRRLILCGDPAQAIYQFAGADSISMSRVEKRLQETSQGCVTLKLTVTRRCCKSVVREAKCYVPDFEAHEDNPEGQVKTMQMIPDQIPGSTMRQGAIDDLLGKSTKKQVAKDYKELVQDGDLILCRANAPLVSEVFKFIRQGRKAIIRGRNIGDGLLKLIGKLERRKETVKTLPGLVEALNTWASEEIKTEMAKEYPNESKVQLTLDKQMCLETLCDEASSVKEVEQKIEDIFSDETTDGITLSSVHRAKGTEAERVFWIQFPRRPFLSPQQVEAEDNIAYVAITRAVKELIKLNPAPKKGE